MDSAQGFVHDSNEVDHDQDGSDVVVPLREHMVTPFGVNQDPVAQVDVSHDWIVTK